MEFNPWHLFQRAFTCFPLSRRWWAEQRQTCFDLCRLPMRKNDLLIRGCIEVCCKPYTFQLWTENVFCADNRWLTHYTLYEIYFQRYWFQLCASPDKTPCLCRYECHTYKRKQSTPATKLFNASLQFCFFKATLLTVSGLPARSRCHAPRNPRTWCAGQFVLEGYHWITLCFDRSVWSWGEMDILIKVKIHLLRLWLTSDKIFPILFRPTVCVFHLSFNRAEWLVCLPGVN